MGTRIAILGTGRMGSALARRLAAAGLDLTLWDRTAEHAKALSLGTVATSPAEASTGADFVISSLTGPEAVRATYLGPVGALSAAHGQTFIEMSTAGPDVETELWQQVAGTSSHLLDATIVGAPVIVEAGEAAILVGGENVDLERARPILEHFGTVRHVGGPGNGARLKLVNNSMLALVTAGAAELQQAGESAGLDAGDVFWILQRMVPSLEVRRPAYVDHEIQPTMFAMHDLRKDLDLALETFHESESWLPLTALARELVGLAVLDDSDKDIASAALQLYRRR